MPLVRIEILKGRPAGERQQLLDALHDALVEAFTIPEDDRTQRIVEHDPENFEIPPGASQRYTLIEITAFPGRSATAKRTLYETIVRNLATAGAPAQDIIVVLNEPPMENWASAGGNLPTKWISATGWTFDSVAGYGSGGWRAGVPRTCQSSRFSKAILSSPGPR